MRQHAQAKHELGERIWAERKKKEEQIKAKGMRMERIGRLLLLFVRTFFFKYWIVVSYFEPVHVRVVHNQV